MSKIDDKKQIVERLHQIHGELKILSDEVVAISRQIGRYTDQLREHPQHANEFVQLENDCQDTLNRITMSRCWSRLKNKSEKIFCILWIYNKGLHHADITRIYTEMEKSDNTDSQRYRMRSLLFELKKQGRLDATSFSFRNVIYRLKDQHYMSDKLGIQLPIIS
ncbi:hypothetical protein [Pedobacter sp. UBA5917]|jgi:hypothetical protein|uniref:hypothetical protein n=1 Tax=Pedobacter sp. UBA5917 TaxID=1947061 RepID=UPI0025E80E64|nr:hypothetical protein [Pedobacter sp. UBA5917]